jgi:hypothetical protein
MVACEYVCVCVLKMYMCVRAQKCVGGCVRVCMYVNMCVFVCVCVYVCVCIMNLRMHRFTEIHAYVYIHNTCMHMLNTPQCTNIPSDTHMGQKFAVCAFQICHKEHSQQHFGTEKYVCCKTMIFAQMMCTHVP